MEPTVEHRKHPRYSVHFSSIFSTDSARLEKGLVLDLSLGGCRLMSAFPHPYWLFDRAEYSARTTRPHLRHHGCCTVDKGVRLRPRVSRVT